MHRRKRIRKQNMPSLMEVDHRSPGARRASLFDGSGIGVHTQAVVPSRKAVEDTNIETLSKQLNKIDISHMAKKAKPKKPKYIDTSKLLGFKRASS
jgi:hypothetical protein